jgi:hypothetical protein
MCLTSNFARTMAVEPTVLAPVVAQPGLHWALDVSASDLVDVRKRIKEERSVVRGIASSSSTSATISLVLREARRRMGIFNLPQCVHRESGVL